jgi:hypothetical protein
MREQNKNEQLQVDLAPTQEKFIFSEKVVNVLYSNTGEGKSFAAVIAMIIHAQRCGMPIRAAIVRDTHENIKLSTVRTIQDALSIVSPRFPIYRFKNDFKELVITTNPPVYVDLFGIDDPASLGKLQGPEYALIWLEEPAPISDKSNAGLSEETYNVALVRCTRQKNTRSRLQITMNPADEAHWTYKRLLEEPAVDPDNPLITKAVFRILPGENKYVSETSRQAVRSAYKNDAASLTRYAEGKFAAVYTGKKVTPEYNPESFLSKVALEPARGLIGFRSWDGWHSPTCSLGQITGSGRLVFLDTIHVENSDVRQLSKARILPLINSPRWKDKVKEWRDIGDFSMMIPDQSNRQESSSRAIETIFDTIFEPGPAKWEHMKLGIHNAFSFNINGLPAFVISPQERLIHRALSGAWHYPVDNSGQISSKLPDKNDASHVGDAWANAVNVLLPVTKIKRDPAAIKKLQERQKAIACSY